MFALTIDQRGSRRSADAVPELIEALNRRPLVRPFERTAGDEVQALTDRADVVVDLVVEVGARRAWWTGVGVGDVDEPLPSSVRASRGPALVAARDAVDEAKRSPAALALRAARTSDSVEDAETALQVLARLVAERSDAGRAAVAAMSDGSTQAEAARTLGISPQAMSRRLAVARWDDERRLRDLARRLLERAS